MRTGLKALSSEFRLIPMIFRTNLWAISANASDPLPNLSDLISNERVLFVVPALRSLRSLHARNKLPQQVAPPKKVNNMKCQEYPQ